LKARKEKKVIYIDSERKHRFKAKGAFAKEKYHCIVCRDGQEGLQKIGKECPDIVVVDARLSDISGEELYTQFLTQSKFKSLRATPFIAITHNGSDDKSKLYNLGFSACLAKPFRAKELVEFVEDVLLSHHLKMEEMKFWETIREAKDFLETVVESSVDSIMTTDKKGIVTYCNSGTEEMLGYMFDELIGNRVSHFLAGGSSELLQILAILKKRGKVQNYKTKIVRKDKKEISINVSISTMKSSDGRVVGALAISKEADGDRYSEYDSLAPDRFAAIVETSVAVNHAINNPLVPILGNAQFLLQNDKITDEDIRKRLRVIVKNALRIRDITQKLAKITHPVTKEYLRGTRMLDIDASM